VDVDDDVKQNDAVHGAEVVRADTYPFPDSAFGACVSNYVLEHVASPGDHLREVWRILRPGAAYVFRTPNIYHYTSVVARLTPHWFHVAVANRLRGLRSDHHEPYPTYHRLNSRRTIISYSAEVGFQVEKLMMVEKEPSYGMASRLLFLALTGYERLVNSADLFSMLRSNIFCVLRK
jgi:SAM-dependent methyltransferase